MNNGIRVSTNNYKYAEWYLRIGALAIDMLIVNLLVLLFYPYAWTFVSAGVNYQDVNWYTTAAGIFIIPALIYMILLSGLLSRTAGMFAMKTRIANINGTRITWPVAVIRSVMYMVSGLIFFIGFLPILFTPKKQGLHDMVSKTMVVKK